MNIDEAIKQAADHIEKYPEAYNFGQGQVVRKEDLPPGYGGPGGHPSCMLARIGEMAGVRTGIGHDAVSIAVLGIPCNEFYQRITMATPASKVAPGRDPLHDPNTIPAAMRVVAKHYEGIPLSVRDIFGMPRVKIRHIQGAGIIMEVVQS